MQAAATLPIFFLTHWVAPVAQRCFCCFCYCSRVGGISRTGELSTDLKRLRFSFDQVYGPGATQEQIFRQAVGIGRGLGQAAERLAGWTPSPQLRRPVCPRRDVCAIATSVLDGYNACIFAYGQVRRGEGSFLQRFICHPRNVLDALAVLCPHAHLLMTESCWDLPPLLQTGSGKTFTMEGIPTVRCCLHCTHRYHRACTADLLQLLSKKMHREVQNS